MTELVNQLCYDSYILNTMGVENIGISKVDLNLTIFEYYKR